MIEIPGTTYIGQIAHPNVNGGQPVPHFAPVDRPNGINTQGGWNALADRVNRRSFAIVFGREPVCEAELRAWEGSHFSKDFRWCQTTQ